MNVPDFVEGHYNTLFIPKHQDMLREWAGQKEEETPRENSNHGWRKLGNGNSQNYIVPGRLDKVY